MSANLSERTQTENEVADIVPAQPNGNELYGHLQRIIERNQNEEFLRLLLTTAISLEKQIK